MALLKKKGFIILLIGIALTISSIFIDVTGKRFVDYWNSEKPKNALQSINWLTIAGIGTIVVGGIVLVLRANKKDEKKVLEK
jgi:hypothetical protein